MKRALAIAFLSIKTTFRDRSALVSMLLVPIALTAIMGAMGGSGGGSKTELSVYDADGSYYSKEVIRILSKDPSIKVKHMAPSAALNAVRDNKLAGLVEVPSGFGARVQAGKPVDLKVHQLEGNSRTAALSESLRGVADRVSADARSADFSLAEGRRREKKVTKEWRRLSRLQRDTYLKYKAEAYARYQAAVAQARAQIEAEIAAQVEAHKRAMLSAPSGSGAGSGAPGSGGSMPAIPNVDKILASKVPPFNFPPPPPPIKKWWKPVKVTPDRWLTLYRRADDYWEPTPPVEMKVSQVQQSKVRGDKTLASGFGQSSLGFTLTFVMFTLLANAAGILEERRMGTLGRLLTAPVRKTSIIGGKILGVYVAGILQAAILIVVGMTVFHVNWGTNLPAVALILGTFILAATGLGIFISSVVRTIEQAQSLTPVIAISMALVGGAYWPIEIVPGFMRVAAKLTPTGWAMTALTDTIVRSRGIEVAFQPALILLAFAAVFFVGALAFLRLD